MIFVAIAGALIVLGTLWEAFETVVLPRRVTRHFRFAVLFYRTTWRAWRAVARLMGKTRRRDSLLGIYGPLSLPVLFGVWAVFLILGFGLLYFGAGHWTLLPRTFRACLYLSGTTFFTLGLGDIIPQTSVERVMVVVESGVGFSFLALVVSYLPVIYQAFSRREVNIVLLDARAGSPPTAAELLKRHTGPRGFDSLQQVLRDWEHASADILESHVSYPVVVYYRSQHSNESWLGALVAILDTCALLIASGDDSACTRQARLTFAMCRHTVVDLAQVFRQAPLRQAPDRLPEADLHRLQASLAENGMAAPDTPKAEAKLAKMRSMYEPFVQALGAYLFVELPPWILAREVLDNWRTSAWGRADQFPVSADPRLMLDDHAD